MKTESITAKASIRIHGSPEETFAAFADAEKMSQFWFTRDDNGLVEGEPCTWALGSGDDAFSFDVQVKSLRPAERIVIEWVGPDGNATQVRWDFAESEDGGTILKIEESGFTGTSEEITARALDSTGGFNQVLIAAKALVEHDVAINVVADHA